MFTEYLGRQLLAAGSNDGMANQERCLIVSTMRASIHAVDQVAILSILLCCFEALNGQMIYKSPAFVKLTIPTPRT